jgi:FixJ family two-component response regulator
MGDLGVLDVLSRARSPVGQESRGLTEHGRRRGFAVGEMPQAARSERFARDANAVGAPPVLVVDSDARTNQVFRKAVTTIGHACLWARCGEECLQVTASIRPGCVVLEVMLEDGSGLQIQRHLLQHYQALQQPVPPIVFVAARTSVSVAVRALRAGALHFLEKPLGTHEVWDAVAEALAVDRDQRNRWAQWSELKRRASKLTDAERQVLDLICVGRPTKLIAKDLGVLCVRTVEMRRNRVMQKLEVASTIDLVHFAVREKDWQPYAATTRRSNGDKEHGARPVAINVDD